MTVDFIAFQKDVLTDLVFEDTYACWEILEKARSRFPALIESDLQMLVVRAMSELVRVGDARAFRVQDDTPEAAAADPSRCVDERDLERFAALNEQDWISSGIWLAATPAGKHKCESTS